MSRLRVLSTGGKFTALAIFYSVLAASLLLAQTNTATISGTVSDPSGAAMGGASVVIDSQATGVRHQVQTNSSGIFSVPQLQPGQYTVTISRDGFGTTKSNVTIVIDQVANLAITMQIGATQQTVEVTGAAPLVESSTAGLGTVIEQKETLDLPLNGRQFVQLLQLAPGTVPISVSQSATPAIGAGSTTPSINGGSNRSNLFYIDGIYATDVFFSTFSISPSIDALQEFKEQTHTDLAEFGQATGGSIDVATKTGTNQFHGTAYEFIRNDDLDARNFFAPVRGIYRQNQFGGVFDGPIIRNKLFFSGFYDGYRYTQAANNFTIVPTQAELNGNFSGIANTIYNPYTYNATTKSITAFSGNMIPTSLINPGIVAYVKNFVPLPNYSGASQNNFLNTEPNTVSQDQGGLRVDYAASTRDNLYGHFMQSEANNISPTSLPQQAFLTGFNGKNAGVNWVHSISPSFIAQVTIGFNELNHPQAYQQANPVAVFNSSGLNAGFTDTPGAIKEAFAPGLSANGYFGVNTGWGPIGPQYLSQYAGSIAKTAGAHDLKFGASFYQTWTYTNWAQDNESYNQQATWNPTTQNGGDGFASMLLGLPNSASRQLGNAGVSLHMNVLGFYGQDSWRVSHKLTVNYGLRWDYSSPVTEKDNRLATVDLANGAWLLAKGDTDAPSTLPGGVSFLNRNSLTPPDHMNFSPRLGLAYQINRKTVLRAGFGIFYDNWSGGEQTAQSARGSWPSGASQSISNLNVAGVTPGVTAQNPFVGFTTALPASPFPSGGTFVSQDFKDSYSSQWNFEIQHQVAKSATVSLAYVASDTNRAPIQVPFNQAPPGPGAIYPRQPYQNLSSPNAISTFAVIESIGRQNYQSLQAKFDQRFSSGVFFITSFTWSKNIDIGCADFWEGCSIQNPYNLNAERGPAPTDVPLILTFSPGYELPFGKSKKYLNHGPGAWLLGDWQVNGIFSARSGTVYTPGINFDNANVGGGVSERPNLVANPIASNPTIGAWFNINAFALPTPYTYGDVGRNSLRGPGFWNMDFSIFRSFEVWERMRLQLRAEFFNVFNNVDFGNPSATLGNPNFGIITSTTNNPRTIQFGAKLNF
jgi:hypothetical protein